MEYNTKSDIDSHLLSSRYPAPLSTPINWSKIVLFIVLEIIIIIGAVFAGIQIERNQTATKKPASTEPISGYVQTLVTPVETPLSPTPTNSLIDWKTYKDKQSIFQFQYPPKLVLNELTQGVGIQTNNNNRIEFYIFKDNSSTISEYLLKADKISQTSYEGQPSIEVQSTKKTVINGLNCIQRKEYLFAADTTRINTYFKNNNFVVSVSIIQTPGNSLIEDESTYQQILSTFIFTK